MKLLPEELKKQKLSIDNFTRLLRPWQVYKPEDDTGIDLQVWPYIGSTEAEPATRQFLVQMKSTTRLPKGYSERPSIPLETEHISGWKQLQMNVLIVLNDLVNETFYFVWDDEISYDPSYKTKSVQLSGPWQQDDSQKVRNSILRKIYPLAVAATNYQLDPEGRISKTVETEWQYGHSTLDESAIIDFANLQAKELLIDEEIDALERHTNNDPSNQHLRIKICHLYIAKGDYKNALYTARKILRIGMSNALHHAQIIVKVINANDLNTLKEYAVWSFAYYFKFVPPVNHTEVEVRFDDQVVPIRIGPDGLFIFPPVLFKRLELKRIGGDRAFSATLLCGLLTNGKLLDQYSVPVQPPFS